MANHRLETKLFYYTYGIFEPALRIRGGDTVTAETRDSMGQDAGRNPLSEEMKQKIPGTALKESNPAVGPIYVEDADEGDLLAIKIERIRLTRNFAVSKQTANFGSLSGEGPGRKLLYNAPISTVAYEWQLDLERNIGIIELPNSRKKRAEVTLCHDSP